MIIPEGWALVPLDMTPEMMRAYMKALRFRSIEIEETIKHLGPEKGPHCAGFVTGFREAAKAAPKPPI